MKGPPPALRVVYLLAVSIGVFWLSELWQVGALLALHAGLWLVLGLGARALGRQLAKIGTFAALIFASYLFSSQDPATDRWRELPVAGATLWLNETGGLQGLLMVLRIAAIVVASHVVRAGDPRALAAGLAALGVPRLVSASIDTVLALMGSGPGSGGGRGRGRGRGDGAELGGFRAALARLARGDVRPITDRLDRQLERADRHLAQGGDPDAGLRDASVVAGISLTMLGIRALKILPAVPFAPGHKLVLLTPLYIIAALRTRSRAGATLTGASMGTVSFLMGDGRYGIFEIAKHVAPGVVCDLFVPALARGGKEHGALVWSLFGGLIAAGRFATILAMTAAVQAPAVAYAILVPGFVVHISFGLLSGYVTLHMLRTLGSIGADYTETARGVAP